ncbi:MAG: serine protease [Chitinophagaceae bacterium]
MFRTTAQVISAEQNYAANSPGVVMVQTVFSATVFVNKVVMNEARFQVLVDSVKRLDTTGTMLSPEEKLDIVVRALYNHPFRFFSATTEYYRQSHRIISSGTGFFITGDGYLVTNAHIIDRDSAYIRRRFILSTYQEVTERNIRSLELSWAMTLTDQQRNLLNNAYSVIYSQVSSMILFDLKRNIHIEFRTGSGASRAITRLPARVIQKGSPMPGKDVAILKVDNVKEMPTLPISPEPARIGEQVLVYGYPEPVTSNAFLAKETTSEPTLTGGIISAIKRSVGGWPVIQMDAVIAHGSSGSPVCNNRGEVIGLATFGTLEQATGMLANSYNFSIPSSVIKEYLDSAAVRAAVSAATQAWHQGLDLYYKSFYGKALNKFKAVQELNPGYPELQEYLAACNSRIVDGAEPEPFRKKSVFRIMALLLVLGGTFIFYRSQRKRPARTKS